MEIDVLVKFRDFIETEFKNIEAYIGRGQVFNSSIFDEPVVIEDRLHDNKSPIRGRKGIYLFMFTGAGDLLEDEINEYNSISGAKIKKNNKPYYNEVDCLYVGSCVSESLYTRINQHYSKDDRYTALKLDNNKRTALKNEVICVAIPMKKEYSEFYRLVLPHIEKRLHEEIYPMAGSSRV